MNTKESYKKSIANTKKWWLLSVLAALIAVAACEWKTNFPFWLSLPLSTVAAYCLYQQHKFGLKEDFVNAMWSFLGCILATNTIVIATASEFSVEGWWIVLPMSSIGLVAAALISIAYRFELLALPEFDD